MVKQGKQEPSARKNAPAKSPARTVKPAGGGSRPSAKPGARPAASAGSRPGTRAPGRPGTRRPSPAVYRRRRQVVFGGLLLVVALVVGGILAISSALAGSPGTEAGASGKDTQSTKAPDIGATPQASAGQATPTPSAVCDLNMVTVAAATDKPAYGADEQPVLSMKVTNGGTVPCQVNMGTSQMEFLVMSGTDRIFSSKDCQVASDDLVKTIEPGASETGNFKWQRNRTLEGCGVIAAKPGAGGATYTFVARLGNKTSTKAVFQLG